MFAENGLSVARRALSVIITAVGGLGVLAIAFLMEEIESEPVITLRLGREAREDGVRTRAVMV